MRPKDRAESKRQLAEFCYLHRQELVRLAKLYENARYYNQYWKHYQEGKNIVAIARDHLNYSEKTATCDIFSQLMYCTWELNDLPSKAIV